MAKIAPALQKLIDDGVVKPPSAVNLDFVSRRQRLNWLVADGTTKPQTFRTIVASTERMNDRAAMGLGFDDKSMAKVARPQKVQPKPVKVRAKAAPVMKPAKVAVPKATKKTKAAAVPKVVPAVAPVVAAPPPPTPPTSATATNVYLVLDQSSSMSSKQDVAQRQLDAICAKLRTESPHFDVTIGTFADRVTWLPARKAKDASYSLQVYGNTALRDALFQAAQKALSAETPALIYLLTDGEENASSTSLNEVQQLVSRALATGRVTFACVGPAVASSFFKSCGIPDACIRRWDGSDAADLAVVTQQATAGVEQFVKARKEGRTKIDSFFVDVVAQGVTVEKAKKQLRDLKALLRVRKISSYVAVEKFVADELKLTYIPGAAYYQMSNSTLLKQGRRLILQPRGQDVYLSGPNVRQLLGLPDDRDIKLEPKNLGDFIVYIQSASTTRKLLPGTQFLYDESHVAGATAPTWSYAAANGGGNGTAGKGN